MSENLIIGAPPPALVESAAAMLAVAQSYVINCPEMREAAGEDLQRVKRLAKDLEDARFGITRPLDQAKARVLDLFRKPAQFLADAESTIKRACLAYDGEQERQRREAEAQAARIADEERKRLAAEAERERAAGNAETAHAITAAAELVAPIPVAATAVKVAGESHRITWHAEVVDMVALAKAVADGAVAAEVLLPNMPALNGLARSLKNALNVPGVRAVSERVLGAKAAA